MCHLCLCPRTLAAVSPHRHHLYILATPDVYNSIRLEFVHEKFKYNLQSSSAAGFALRVLFGKCSSAFWKMLKDKSKRRESR